MMCQKCKNDFQEREIEESHDAPCYLFSGYNRKERKNKADKFQRHWLCEKCHKRYEEGLRLSFKILSKKFSDKFFGDKK